MNIVEKNKFIKINFLANANAKINSQIFKEYTSRLNRMNLNNLPFYNQSQQLKNAKSLIINQYAKITDSLPIKNILLQAN